MREMVRASGAGARLDPYPVALKLLHACEEIAPVNYSNVMYGTLPDEGGH